MMCENRGKRVLIVSGGTGGHIFPALVFGRWLEEQRGACVSYLSGSRPLEADIYGSAGVKPWRLSLDGSPLGVRSPGKILRRSFAMLSAFSETSRCFKEMRPDVVFLFGGYVSFVPLLLCRLRGLPAVIHEQNSVAGRVTRLASRMGAVIVSGWEECVGLHGPHIPVGVPVRAPVRLSREEAERRLGLSPLKDAQVVGVAGGSLGSRSLMEKVLEAADALAGRERPVEFLFLGDGAAEGRGNVRFVGRQWDMDPFYSLCDVLICRAGASTLAEALRWGLPTVTVPWPGAADGHQERNALCFADEGGGVVWREGSREPLVDALEELLRDSRGAQPPDDLEDASLAIARAAGL